MCWLLKNRLEGGKAVKKRSWISVLTLMLALGLVLSACNFDSSKKSSSGDSKSSGGTKQVLSVVEAADMPTLDSVKAHDGISFTVLNNTKEGLYRLDKNNAPILAMAKKEEVSDDGLVYTFTLRDAKWSNGKPVTANDFVYAWQRVFKEAGDYQTMFETALVKNASAIIKGDKKPEDLGVKAVDDKTLQVTLERPNPLFESLMTFPTFLPQNQEFVEGQGSDYALEYDKVLANGPFILSDWKHDQGWTYKKNPDYWDKKNVKLNQINVDVVKEVPTRIKLYETGKVDRVILSASYVDQYRDDKNFKVESGAETYFLRFNHKEKALGNVNIRRAIGMAIDKKGLVDVIMNNGSKALYGLVPQNFSTSPDGKGFRELNGPINKGTFAEAKKYFDKGLKEIGEKAVKVSIMSSDEDADRKTSEALKAQLEKNLPGLTIDIKTVPFEQRLELEKAIDYDISLSSWGPDYGDPMTYIGMWVTGGSANRMGYSNPKYDALVDKANKETDKAKRYQMLLDAEKIALKEDAAVAPLYQQNEAILLRSSVKKLLHHPFGPNFTYKWTYIDKK